MDPSLFLNPSMGISTLDDLRALVSMRSGSAHIRFRFLVLDSSLNPVTLTAPADANHPSDMGDHVISCTVDTQSGRDIARSMTITMDELPGFELNPVTHRIRVMCCFEDANGNDLISVPLITARPFQPDRTIADALITENGTFQCVTGVVADRGFIHEYAPPAGTLTGTVARALFMADDRPASRGGRSAGGGYPDANNAAVTPAGCFFSGCNLPASRVIVDNSPVPILDGVRWTNKDNVTSALAQMADTGLYLPWWGDAWGNAVMRLNPFQYGSSIPSAQWVFTSDNDGIIDTAVTVKYPDLSKLKNYIAVVVENSGRETLFAESWNDSADSLISTLYTEVRPITLVVDSLPDQATAQRYADVARMKYAMAEQQLSFTLGSIVPWLDINDLIGFDVSVAGVAEIRTDYPYMVTSTSIDCVNRTQSITCQRVIGL